MRTMLPIFLGFAASLVTVCVEHDASARSFRVTDIPNGSTYKCIDCHLTSNGSGYTGFGNDVRNSLTGFISSAHVDWSKVCHLDSDGDGLTNGQELGDPNCTWTRGMPNPPGPTSNPGDPNSKISVTSSPSCGNGVLESGEQCDGTELGGKTCESLGLGSGTLACNSACKFETSGCSQGSTTSGSGSGAGGSGDMGAGGSGGGSGTSNGGSFKSNAVSPRNPPPVYPLGCSASAEPGTPFGALAFFVIGAVAAFRKRARGAVSAVKARLGRNLGPLLTFVLVGSVAAMAALAGCVQSSAITQGFGGYGGMGNGGATATTGVRGNAATTDGSTTNGNGATTGGVTTAAGNGTSVAAGTTATTGVGATTSATVGSTTSSGSGGGGTPTTCAQADNDIGCCTSSGHLYYCQTGMLTGGTCPSGTVCGWNASQGYYDCVASPGGADPSGTYPKLCNASGGGSTTSSTTTTTSSGGGTVTWTQIYTQVFGPSGSASCTGSTCHTSSVSGFACGTTKTACYNGFVNSGMVTPGASATSSQLVDPATSPLCGSLGGNMPKGGNCITSAELTMINSWLAAGAPNN